MASRTPKRRSKNHNILIIIDDYISLLAHSSRNLFVILNCQVNKKPEKQILPQFFYERC